MDPAALADTEMVHESPYVVAVTEAERAAVRAVSPLSAELSYEAGRFLGPAPACAVAGGAERETSATSEALRHFF
jgi:hypothetical protein